MVWMLTTGSSLIMPGVPRILEGTLPKHLGPRPDSSDQPQIQDSKNRHEAFADDWAPYAEYLKTTRININVRQVFPRGFEIPTL
jgi:alkylated DNA repair protein alkB family protein 1